MKKIVIIFSLMFLLIGNISNYAMAASAQPISYNTDCPVKYQGTSNCYYVSKPKTIVTESVKMPSGKPIVVGNDVYNSNDFSWGLGHVTGYVTKGVSSVTDTVRGWWSNVVGVTDKTEKFISGLSKDVRNRIVGAVNNAKTNGDGYITLSRADYDVMLGEGVTVLSDDFNFDEFKVFGRYGGEGAEYAELAHSYFDKLPFDNQYKAKEIKVLAITTTDDDYRVWVSGEFYTPRTSDYWFGGYVPIRKTDKYVKTFYRSILSSSNSIMNGFGSYESIKPKIPFVFMGNNGGYNVQEDSEGNVKIPYNQTQAIPAVVEVDGKKYFEVANPKFPNVPNLVSVDSPTSPPLSGGVIVEGDTGFIINDDGTVSDTPPVTPPIENENPNPPEGGGDDLERNPNEDGEKFSQLFTNKFPFSLPWDFAYLVNVLLAEPERPHFKLDEKMGSIDIKFEHDFAWMDSWIVFFRAFVIIGFIFTLIWGTRSLLGGAK